MTFWTEENTAEAPKLSLEGKSATEVAKLIGAVSRNSVIGRLNRVGFQRPTVASTPRLMKRRREPKARAQPRKIGPPPAPIPEEIPNAGVTIFELGHYTCRWPLGGNGADMKYCGCRTDGIYCGTHKLRAFLPRTEGQKAAGVRGALWAAR